jgi:hypothetical protein
VLVIVVLFVFLLDPCAQPEAKYIVERVVVPQPQVVAPDHPLAVALVVNGQETWIGNDDYEPVRDPLHPDRPNPARVSGVLKPLKIALDSMPFAPCAPRGSKGLVVTFGDKAEVVKPLGDLAQLDGAALGDQRAYSRRLGTALVLGVELGLDQLASTSAARKVMIVISDGNDTDNDAGASQLAALRARSGGVEVYAIEYKGLMSDPTSITDSLTRDVVSVRNPVEVIAALAAIRARVCR